MRPLVFKPNELEMMFIEDNKISWSEYCHSNLHRDMNNKKYVRMDIFQMPLVMVIVGTLVLLIGISNIHSDYLLLVCYILSIASISFGIFSIVGGLKRNG